MSQKKIPKVAFRAFTRPIPTPYKPSFARQTPREPPSHDPNLLPRVFTPATPVRTNNAYPGRPRTSLQLDQPGTTFAPYFPRDTVFVFNPPKEPYVPYKEREAEKKKREAEKKLAAPEHHVENKRPMTSHIDILTTPTADTPGGCLYVHFDKKRYLFGRVGEGTQRAMNQRKSGMSTLEHIFISGEVNWATVGGMMGFILTVADVIVGSREAHAEMNRARAAKGQKEKVKSSDNVERLDIHGAENLTYSLATSRNFLFRTGMPFKTCELAADPRLADPKDSKPDFEDECLRVWKVPIYKQGPSRKRRREGEDEADETDVDSPTHKKRKSDEQRALGVLVESMFNSDWHMDALVPTKLLDVNLPAAIFTRAKDNSIQRYKGPLPESGKDVPNIDVLVREPWPATKVHTLPQTQPSAQAMCYIGKNHPRRGRFMVADAKALGVDPRDNKKLIAGESVPGKDGTTVTPDMVMEPQQKCQGFVVADIADVSYIGTFMSRPEWSNEEVMDGIAVVYWILGQGVVSHPDIQSFMRARPGMKHVVMAPDTCPNMIAFESHAALTAKLQRINPDRFPTPKFNNLVPNLGIADAPFIAGRTGKRIRTMPSL
ncbi:hypothetical protein IMZ48_45435, partial [Candidatus Bathyarchaeota archaeon]|nr:hypothetical protein [Candidatus Bathyarchaeota archaeon]